MSDRKNRQKPVKSPPKDRLWDLPIKAAIWIGLGIPMSVLMVVGVVVLWIRDKNHVRQERSRKRRGRAREE